MEKLWGGIRGDTRTKPRTLTKRPPAESVSALVVAPSKDAVRSRRTLVIPRTTPSIPVTSKTSLQPHTQTEQYWAARALSAETLLSAKTAHHNEVRDILLAAENKRRKELYEQAREHNARHARLEKLVAGLLLSLLTFVLCVIYLLAKFSDRRPRDASQWSKLLPGHFTIPILSPFTSVVESENAVIGTRTIGIFIVIAGATAYGILRHRISIGLRGPS